MPRDRTAFYMQWQVTARGIRLGLVSPHHATPLHGFGLVFEVGSVLIHSEASFFISTVITIIYTLDPTPAIA